MELHETFCGRQNSPLRFVLTRPQNIDNGPVAIVTIVVPWMENHDHAWLVLHASVSFEYAIGFAV